MIFAGIKWNDGNIQNVDKLQSVLVQENLNSPAEQLFHD